MDHWATAGPSVADVNVATFSVAKGRSLANDVEIDDHHRD
jgi:hypothetical protein